MGRATLLSLSPGGQRDVCSDLLVKDQVTARIVPRGRRASPGVVSCCHGDFAGGEYVALSIEVNPGDRMGGSLGDLTEKRALGAAVTLAERMDGVDLCVVMRQALCERLEAQSLETVFACEVREQPRQVGADVLRQGKQVAALGDAYRAQLAGPRVDVAEDVAVCPVGG